MTKSDTMRAVPESVLVEALEQIEATYETNDGELCRACGKYPEEYSLARMEWRHRGGPFVTPQHKPDCRFVRVRDALKGSLGK